MRKRRTFGVLVLWAALVEGSEPRWIEVNQEMDRLLDQPAAQAVPRFVALLDDEYPFVRRRAAQSLRAFGATAAVKTALIQAIYDEDPRVGQEALTSLLRLEPPDDTTLLFLQDAMRHGIHPHPEARRYPRRNLPSPLSKWMGRPHWTGGFRQPVPDRLAEAFTSEEPALRAAAMRAVARHAMRLRTADQAADLLRLLADPDWRVAGWAADAAAFSMGEDQGAWQKYRSALVSLLKRTEAFCRRKAARALAVSGPPGVELLVAIAKDKPRLRQLVLETCAGMRPAPPAVVALAAGSLDTPNLTEPAIRVLGSGGPAAAAAVPKLASLLRSRGPLAEVLCRALGQIGAPHPDALAALEGMVRRAGGSRVQHAARALALLGGEGARRLLPFAEKGTPSRRRTVLLALATVRKEPEGLDALLKRAAQDPDAEIRQAALSTQRVLTSRRRVVVRPPRGRPGGPTLSAKEILAAIGSDDIERRRVALGQLRRLPAKDALECLPVLLKSKERMVARAAAHALATLGQKGHEVLLGVLGERSEAGRAASNALRSAKNLGSAVLKARGHERWQVRRAVAWILANQRRWTDLRPLLGDENPKVRKSTLQAMGGRGRAAIVPLLLERLSQEELPELLAPLIYNLGHYPLRVETVVKPVRPFLAHENERVRQAASHTLGRLGGPGVPPLNELLRSERVGDRLLALHGLRHARSAREEAFKIALRDPSPVVRAAAVEVAGLGPEGDRVCLDALQDAHWTVRRAAVRTLRRRRRPPAEAAKPLVGLLEDRELRPYVERALQALGKDAVDALLGAPPATRNRAAEVLRRIGRPAALVLVERIRAARGKPDLDVVWGLGSIGPEAQGAVPDLIRLLDAKSETVVAQAVWALGRIGAGALPALPRLRKLVGHPDLGGVARDAIERIQEDRR